MTNEEKDLLIAYLVDTGDNRPRRRRGGPVLGVVPGPGPGGVRRGPLQGRPRGCRVRERSYPRGYRTGGSVRWDEWAPPPGPRPLGPTPWAPPPGPHPTCSLSAKTNRSATTARPAAATSKVTLPAALAVWQCLARGRLGSRT